MTRAGWLSCVLAAMVLCASPLAAQPPAPALTVVSSGPSGALASLDQANELRIVFSEAMVTLGRIPAVVTAPFVRITGDALPEIKDVAHTNFCDIGAFSNGKQIVVFSAIDNLVKGAAGQAVQNMNLMFGLDEKTGLIFAGGNP